MDRLSDVDVFLRVVEHQSFARAAAALGISRSYASRMVSGLEDRLGVRLLHRTTRTVLCTATGRAFYDATAPLLEGVAEAEALARAEAVDVRGPLKVSLPRTFGARYLLQPMFAFQQAHPGVQLTVDLDDRKVDLAAAGYDLAVRGASALEGALQVRMLWSFDIFPVASPGYLAKVGAPETPADLAGHRGVLYSGNHRPDTWTFERGGAQQTVVVPAGITVNDASALVEAARAGLGVALAPEWAAADGLRDGSLTRLLPDWRGPSAGFWIVRPEQRMLPVRVRALIDFLVETLQQPPWRAGKG